MDVDDYPDSATPPTSPTVLKDSFRKRSSRACDQCRKAKSRCDPSASNDPCKSCRLSGIACTFQEPSQTRGPPKGYLQALDTRLHEAEALLGVIISSPEAEHLVTVLSKDPLAEKIISRVNHSVFGALGRPHDDKPLSATSRGRRRFDKEQQRMFNGQFVYSKENGTPVFTSPSYAWQDHLKAKLASEPGSPTPYGPPGTVHGGSSTTASYLDNGRRQKRRTELTESLRSEIPTHDQTRLYSTPSEDMDTEIQNVTDLGIGKLSLDNYQQVRYHGEASGLTLLGQTRRTDSLYHQQIWRMPPAHLYRLGSDTPNAYEDLELEAILPSRSIQEHLLRQYFHYVHPVLPIVNRDEFWDDWTSMHKFGSGGPAKLLLLAMLALSARYSDPESPHQSSRDLGVAGNNYMEAAKSLLNQTYSSSRLSTCQALLLLGYRDIGLSGMANAALFTVMAIQMAQDLGLNRHAEEWSRDGACVFSESRLQLRRSVWCGCVVLDTHVAAQLGRPLHIRREDYDTRLPDINTQEDFQIWMPYRNTPASQGYDPLPGRITSCFRYLCSLTQIFSSILHKFYAVNVCWTAAQKHEEYFEIDQKLQRWYMELPETIRFTTSPAPPPHILCLHMFYWCAVVLLQRTFIQSRSHDPQLPPRRALDLGAAAATNLTNIVHTYNTAFGLRHSPALLTYYLMTAGIMHVALLQVHPTDIQAKIGLDRCLSALDGMKDIWPAAYQTYTFLSGVNLEVPDLSPVVSNGPSRKRQLNSSSNSGPSNHASTSTLSVASEPSNNDMSAFHPVSFLELSHSLGLESSSLDRVFESSGYATAWPSDEPFQGMHEQQVPPNPTVLPDK